MTAQEKKNALVLTGLLLLLWCLRPKEVVTAGIHYEGQV
jgi:hypothetical protein